MLVRVLVFAGIIAVAATQVPSLFEKPSATAEPPQAAMTVSASPKPAVTASVYGTVVLEPDARGHYQGDFKINGKPVHGLVDTGATYVSINESTARRLGFVANDLDYRYTSQTANGAAKVAVVKLDRLEIGTIKLLDIDAVVMKDESLGTTLIGMSFLKKLSSYGVESGSLRLTD